MAMPDEVTLRQLPNAELKEKIDFLKSQTMYMSAMIEQEKEKFDTKQREIEHNTKNLLKLVKLPYAIANIIEILEVPDEDADNLMLPPNKIKNKRCAVISTSSRSTLYLPEMGLLREESLLPGDLVGVNKDTYMLYQKLPTQYDSRVKSMLLETDKKPEEDYGEVGGLENQIKELNEAVVLPMTNPDIFKKLGVRPPKGVLLFGPPGTGKTLLARACANQTKAAFIRMSATQLTQTLIGEGSRMVRDCFDLAKKKIDDEGFPGTIVFIDELDAIGMKRGVEGTSHETQRTMLELLNQLDGFSSDSRIKVIAATNRPDILDPALLRSGRLDRKIELPNPNEEARVMILQIHSRKMVYNKESVIFEEIARSTEDFSGAMLKAVCVEAGMLALRREATKIEHEDYMEGVGTVASRKKANLMYYA